MKRFLLLPLLLAAVLCGWAQDIETLPGVITIPVVVHVVYNNAQQNISDAQIRSQLDVLNQDYRGTNTDRSLTPSYFAGLAADAGFRFQLATADAKGNATSGIVRKMTSIQYFSTDDRIKNASIGGDAAWDRSRYLNIWVCNLTGGVLGYTSAPGCPADKDGVVISFTAFGNTGTAGYPFNGGRTATHEIGHWLNLRHLWGDTYCGDDGVDDTPAQRGANKGTPTGERFTCGTTAHGDMYMNFMDLTNDASMHLFTRGQRDRMRALFAAGGARNSILNSTAFTVTAQPISAPIVKAPTETAPSQLSVYPNPAISTITINTAANDAEAVGPFVIFSAGGQPLLTQAVAGEHTTIAIGQLTPGLYFIRRQHGTAVARFIKQ